MGLERICGRDGRLTRRETLTRVRAAHFTGRPHPVNARIGGNELR